jgi:hypothetical protein
MNSPRLITTCPSALGSLIRKGELLGEHTDHNIDQQQRTHSSVTFSVDFVNYYFGLFCPFVCQILTTVTYIHFFIEREKKIPELYAEMQSLKLKQDALKTEDTVLRDVYKKVSKTHGSDFYVSEKNHKF